MSVSEIRPAGQEPPMTGGSGDTTAFRLVEEAAASLGDGRRQLILSVPAVHCGACIRAIEAGLAAQPGILDVRVNLSLRRVRVVWREDTTTGAAVLAGLKRLGFEAHVPDPDREAAGDEARYRQLLLSLAVSGFAAGNVMLMSVAIWSGAEASTRDLFHWVSGLIAIPAVAVAGRPFFSSAAAAIAARRLNMDVPIALAVLLALVLSILETARGGPHAYFDAAVGLLFFLLIGRTLDHLMRRRARGAAVLLSRLAPRSAILVQSDGRLSDIALAALVPGDSVLVRPGDRVPVDGTVLEGPALLDVSIVTGESSPVSAAAGMCLSAGMLNLGTAFRLRATAPASESFIAGVTRLMEAAEGAKARYRRLSDRAAEIYAPAVHVVAAVTFLAWWLASGDPYHAAYSAIAVLIITCPCALALAVPIVHVVAASQLFRSGVLLKDGEALERLAQIDHVVLDKTGTLTTGTARVANADAIDDRALALAAGLSRISSHPLAQAICVLASARGIAPCALAPPREIAGFGLELADGAGTLRLGRAGWAGRASVDAAGTTILARNGTVLAVFDFDETPRPGIRAMVRSLTTRGINVEILSGDHAVKVGRMARAFGIPAWRAAVTPAGKQARLGELTASGCKVLMIGDGLNDGPALSAAHASMAPSEASDIGRNAADLVFLGDSLAAVPYAVDMACRAQAMMLQNLALALVYNLIAVPIAVTGLATPMVAAISMSLSSLVVTANAMRLSLVPPLADPVETG